MFHHQPPPEQNQKMRSFNNKIIPVVVELCDSKKILPAFKKSFGKHKWLKWPFPPIMIAPILVPILDWLPNYALVDLSNDLVAGITVFVLLIPQGMAYSIVAGLPPVYGLYAAAFPPFIYAMLGTSRHLSLGPMALTSLMLQLAVHDQGYLEGTEEYIQVALNITMLVGIISYLIGAFRLGVVVNFLSQSVLSGFVSGSSCVIMLSQMKYILGIPTPKFKYSHQVIVHLCENISHANLNAMSIGITAWVLLYATKLLRAKYKKLANDYIFVKIIYILSNASSLISIIITSIIARNISQAGGIIQLVGYVPVGLRTPGFAFLGFETILKVIPSSTVIAVVAFTGNWAVAKKFAYMLDYEVCATQELIATGLTNIIGVFFSSFIVSGGIARTAVNVESGARTQLSGCIAATLIILALLFFTKWFYFIPMAILGAIINVSVVSLIDFDDMMNAYKIDKQDFAVMVCTFLCTFFVGISEGIFVGVLVSIFRVIKTSAYPHIAHLGKLPEGDGGHFRDVERFCHAKQIPNVAIVRMDASLYFANCQYFKEVCIKASKGRFHSSPDPIHLVVLDTSAWINIDLSGLKVLNEIHADLLANGIQLAFALAKGPLRDDLRRTKFIEKLGEKFMHMSIEDAIWSLPSRRSSLQLELKSSSDIYGEEVLSPSARARRKVVTIPGDNMVGEIVINPMISSSANDEFDYSQCGLEIDDCSFDDTDSRADSNTFTNRIRMPLQSVARAGPFSYQAIDMCSPNYNPTHSQKSRNSFEKK